MSKNLEKSKINLLDNQNLIKYKMKNHINSLDTINTKEIFLN